MIRRNLLLSAGAIFLVLVSLETGIRLFVDLPERNVIPHCNLPH